MNIGLKTTYLAQIPYWIFLYQEGDGHKRIGKKCNVSKSTVYTALNLFGIIDSNRDGGWKKNGNDNPMWVGNKVSYNALHAWVRRNLPPPDLCMECNNRPALDLANISSQFNPATYNRNFSNWEYLCRSCHMIKDGRMKNLKQYEAE